MPNIFSNDKNRPTTNMYRHFRLAIIETIYGSATGARWVVAGQNIRDFATLAEADDAFFAELDVLEAPLDPMVHRVSVLYAATVSEFRLQGVDPEEWTEKLGIPKIANETSAGGQQVWNG